MSIELKFWRIAASGTCAAVGLALAAPVVAQDDVQNQSVVDRKRPEYESNGVRFGSFVLRPSVTASVSHSSNILADETNEISDVIFSLTPEVAVRLERPVVDLSLNAGTQIERFADTTSENTETYFAEARAIVGRGRATQGIFDLQYRSQDESRRDLDSVNDLSTRLSRESMMARAELRQDLGAVKAMVAGRVRQISYGSARNESGDLIDYSFRDRKIYQVSGGGEYAITANDLVIGRIVYDKRVQDVRPGDPGFEGAGFDRSSEGWRMEAGYGRQVSELLYLRAFVGYLKQDFDDPLLQDISGLSFNADAFWNVTPLTSMRFRASRGIDEVVSTELAGNLRTQFSAQVDHELRRNLIVSAFAGYADIDPKGIGTSSEELQGSLTGRLFVSRYLSLEGGFRHFQRNSSNVGIRFDENIVFAGIRFQI